jgi:hypothetical protein
VWCYKLVQVKLNWRTLHDLSTYRGFGDDNGVEVKSSSSSSTRTSAACRVQVVLSAAAVVKDTVKLVFGAFFLPLAKSCPRGSNCRLVVWDDLQEQDHRIESCNVLAYPWMRCNRVANAGFTDLRIVSIFSLFSVKRSSSLLQSSSSSSNALMPFLFMPNLIRFPSSNLSFAFLGLATRMASRSLRDS